MCLGIFPASFVHVREELDDAEGRLTQVWDELYTSRGSSDGLVLSASVGSAKGKGRAKKRMEALAEEEEEEDDENESIAQKEESKLNGRTQPQADDGGRRPSLSLLGGQPRQKVAPPIPSLKAGDETVSGSTEPLVDEISTALREWYAVSRDLRP